jgi:serine protease inhibitor ecotin
MTKLLAALITAAFATTGAFAADAAKPMEKKAEAAKPAAEAASKPMAKKDEMKKDEMKPAAKKEEPKK